MERAFNNGSSLCLGMAPYVCQGCFLVQVGPLVFALPFLMLILYSTAVKTVSKLIGAYTKAIANLH